MKITESWVKQICEQEIFPLWNQMPETFPPFMFETNKKERDENEKFLKQSLSAFQKQMKNFPSELQKEEEWKEETNCLIKQFLAEEKILQVMDTIGETTFLTFEQGVRQFVTECRAFDETLQIEDIWQALRNYFIYAMIMDFQGKEQECKTSALAYSLLYPYTDNFIDCKEYTSSEKTEFNNMIKTVLEGYFYQPKNRMEEKTCSLLLMIRDYYGTEKWQQIADGLLLMLGAQEQSRIQQSTGRNNEPITDDTLFLISAYKGSISVLNDYIFAEESPCTKEAQFYLKFGFLLQLADDLQDIAEDRASHSQTIMTRAADAGCLEAAVNRLLHFTQEIFGQFCPGNPALHQFALKNCLMMTLSTVAVNQRLFSTEYVAQVEKYLPMPAGMLQKNRSVLSEQLPNTAALRARQMHILDVMMQT